MAAWAASNGEAIHTQTFLGHPVACAAAVAVIQHIRGEHCSRVRERGEALVRAFGARVHRGRGLIRAVEIKGDAIGAMRHLLELVPLYKG